MRRLRGLQRVTLAPGATQTVTLTLDKSDSGLYDSRGRFAVEPGDSDVDAGDSSGADLEQTFTVSGRASARSPVGRQAGGGFASPRRGHSPA